MLHQLKANPKARNHRTKRVGRGFGSGIGGRSTRGTKGQKARKSGNVRLGFEGGQTPLYVRVGKIGFNNHNFTTKVSAISLNQLSYYPDIKKFDLEKLIELGLVKNRNFGQIKIIGNIKLTQPLEISAHAFSKGAASAITAAGGSVIVLKK
ncbi:LSU ribosomal protein L15p (L27Ae) [[Mycoplasma] cavipharyngis]|uniref:50S ribosomal protein L15 n=1 Tax=[Mycoplasma] cavipharyngis TaxID=92757 RepID=UPI00370430B0